MLKTGVVELLRADVAEYMAELKKIPGVDPLDGSSLAGGSRAMGLVDHKILIDVGPRHSIEAFISVDWDGRGPPQHQVGIRFDHPGCLMPPEYYLEISRKFSVVVETLERVLKEIQSRDG